VFAANLAAQLHPHHVIQPNTGYILIARPAGVIVHGPSTSDSAGPRSRRRAGTLVTSLSWLFLALHPSDHGVAASSSSRRRDHPSPRHYEYISRLAPPDSRDLHGFAFLPIDRSFVGGWFGGRVMHHFGGEVSAS
jgi:hypothetical protein